MTALKSTVIPRTAFESEGQYRVLPCRFNMIGERAVVTNDVGEYVVLPRAELECFVDGKLDAHSPFYRDLKTRHFLLESDSRVGLDLLSLKLRSRLERLAEFTALHIFVVTLRCDHSCQYCQVSRQDEGTDSFDMSVLHAEKSLEWAFQSPAKALKIEFQGGEPLLNFSLIKHLVLRSEILAQEGARQVSFVIASNLSRLTDEILEFCAAHQVMLSTSLDGPRDLHDAQRHLRGQSSYDLVTRGIHRAREALGYDGVAALMTTTPATLDRIEEVIDEYVRLGFRSIFLRHLSPYGFAAKSLVRRYGSKEWSEVYERGIRYILSLNARGVDLREEFTAILLQKMFAPLGTGYVDLQSPAGIGIGALVYNYDGYVYASDEGRMLAEMGDTSFQLGHLDTDAYADVMLGDALLEPLQASMLESAPLCSDCAYLPYCGADPTFHHATQGDWLGHKAFSSFCERQTRTLDFVIQLLADDPNAREILMKWVQ